MELDPTLLKALNIFHSRTPASAEQLKAMLDDAIKNSRSAHNNKETTEKLSLKGGKTLPNRSSSWSTTADQRKDIKDLSLKRNHGELHQDIREVKEVKKPHIITSTSPSFFLPVSSNKKSLSKCCSPAHKLTICNGKYEKLTPWQMTSSTGDFAVEVVNRACAVCKTVSEESDNLLVKCRECHSIFHQKCQPSQINNQDLDDPHHITYCTMCKPNLKKGVKEHIVRPQVPLESSVSFHEEPSNTKTHLIPNKQKNLKVNINSCISRNEVKSNWSTLNSKAASSSNKHVGNNVVKSSILKQDTSSLGHRDKPKVLKKHVRKFDHEAESFKVKPTVSEDKILWKGTNDVASNAVKRLTLSNAAWLSTPGTNITEKCHSKQSLLASNKMVLSSKVAAENALGKNSSTPENANKRLQMVKKRAASKMLLKKTRI